MKVSTFFIASCLVSILGLSSCSEQPQNRPAPKVSVLTPVFEQVVTYDSYPGRVEAVKEAQIRSRVSGYVEEVHYDEGSYVDKNSLLFTIDPRAAKADAEAKTAEVEAAKSEARFASSNLSRAKGLLDAGAISREEFESRRRVLSVARASLRSSKQALNSSKSNLDYSLVKAPFAGRVSEAMVDIGSLTSPEVVMTTIVSIDPIYVVFEIDEASAKKYRATLPGFSELLSGKKPENSVPVEIDPEDGTGFSVQAKLDFIDNRLDVESGTLLARAVVENGDSKLQPNFFVKVRIPQNSEKPSLLVPRVAVLSQLTMRTVLIVNDQNIVEPRPITLGQSVGDRVQVLSGLTGKERVVVDNLTLLFPGQKVEIASKEASKTEPTEKKVAK